MRKKRAMTLLEIMIVIFLIGLIGSVIGYNMKGSLEEGKAFKSEQGISQIKDILELQIAKGTSLHAIIENPELYLKKSGLVKDPRKMLKDGWGEPYTIESSKRGNDILISSRKLNAYLENKKRDLPKQAQSQEALEDEEND